MNSTFGLSINEEIGTAYYDDDLDESDKHETINESFGLSENESFGIARHDDNSDYGCSTAQSWNVENEDKETTAGAPSSPSCALDGQSNLIILCSSDEEISGNELIDLCNSDSD